MSRRPRIVALADSLALPRDEKGEVLLWEETWPYLLAEQLAGAVVPPVGGTRLGHPAVLVSVHERHPCGGL